MAQAGRRFLDGRTRTAGLLHGFVLGDGDAAAAAVSARSLYGVADAVTVLERRGLPATELLVSGATAGRAEVRALDERAFAGDVCRLGSGTSARCGFGTMSCVVRHVVH